MVAAFGSVIEGRLRPDGPESGRCVSAVVYGRLEKSLGDPLCRKPGRNVVEGRAGVGPQGRSVLGAGSTILSDRSKRRWRFVDVVRLILERPGIAENGPGLCRQSRRPPVDEV